MTLTVTFKLGTDPDMAQQLVQNRVEQAEPRLPEEVRRLGVTTVKSAVDLTMVVHLVSPSERYDMTYLRNYALLNVKDRLARIEGVGQVLMWGAATTRCASGSTRARSPSATFPQATSCAPSARRTCRPPPASSAARPAPDSIDLQLSINAQGRLQTAEEFGDIIVKSERRRRHPAARRRAHRARRLRLRAALAARQQAGGGDRRSSPRPAPTRCRSPTTCAAPWPRSRRRCPRASTTRSSTTRRSSCAPRSRRWSGRCSKPSRSSCWW